jgi:DNA-binding response OmpR family regulator
MARILIAEDNRVTAEMMEVRLKGIGHEVTRAENGRVALERVRESRPDLILLDIMMPELDGIAVLKQLKADALMGSIPVLIVSARAQEEDILAALASGANDYITKPFSLRELVARVDRALSQGPEPLRIAVQSGDNDVAVGEVVQATPRGTSVRFPGESAPRLAIGDRAKLSLNSPGLGEALELQTEVVSRGEAEPLRTYEFQFLGRTRTDDEMTRAFLDLIGRRGAYRVSMDPDAPTEVRVLAQAGGESREFLGTLLDVSTGGVRLVLKADAERHLYLVDHFEIRFRLPGGDEPLTLTVSIRHRVRCSEGVAYGTRFEPDSSPDFLEQVEQISTFVLKRTSAGAT